RRLLGLKRKRFVVVYMNHDRENIPRLILSFCIELFAKPHNIDASRAKSRSDRRCRICLSCWNLQLNYFYELFCHILLFPYTHYSTSAPRGMSSTCQNSRSSTLVSRPKIDTITLRRPLS